MFAFDTMILVLLSLCILHFKTDVHANVIIEGKSIGSGAQIGKLTNTVEPFEKNGRWQLQASNVCFGAKDDTFGSFKLNDEGFIVGIKLVHRSGAVTCDTRRSCSTKWGCTCYGRKDLDDVRTCITDELNRLILPTGPFKVRYNHRGYHANSTSLTLTDRSSNQLYGEKGMPMRLWYTEDLKDIDEGDNAGRSCADVYVMFH